MLDYVAWTEHENHILYIYEKNFYILPQAVKIYKRMLLFSDKILKYKVGLYVIKHAIMLLNINDMNFKKNGLHNISLKMSKIN